MVCNGKIPKKQKKRKKKCEISSVEPLFFCQRELFLRGEFCKVLSLCGLCSAWCASPNYWVMDRGFRGHAGKVRVCRKGCPRNGAAATGQPKCVANSTRQSSRPSLF